MSREGQQRFHNPPRNLPPPTKNNRDYKREVEQLNTQLKRLSQIILPQPPYLLSVPSDVPYRHSSRFVNTWYVDTPFAREEEQLQYMSFLPHREIGEELLLVEGDWSDDQGNMLKEEERSPRNIPTSGRNTPTDAQRKKISLNDYKSKSKATEPVVTAEQPRDLKKQSQKVNHGLIEEQDGCAKGKESEKFPPAGQGIKRPRVEAQQGVSNMDGSNSISGQIGKQESPDSPRPEKRPRIASPPSEDTPTNDLKAKKSAMAEVPDLPGLLSPTLPSPEKDKLIPGLVSPTLPPSIAKFLSSQTAQSQNEGAFDHQRTDPVRSILASAGLGLSPNSGMKKGPNPGTLAAGNHVRSDSQHSVRSTISTASAALGIASPSLKGSIRTPLRPGTPLQSGVRASPGPRQRHIVALKYGKKNRKRVEGLLKFAPRPKKPDPRQLAAPRSEPAAAVKKPTASEDGIRPKKRLLEESPEISAKRQKPQPAALNLAVKSNTPAPGAFKSPSAQPNNSQPKSVFSTPKKDHKPTTMQRVASTESLDVPTPPGDRVRLSTPLSMERSAASTKAPSPPPTSAPTSKDEEKAAWQTLNLKYFSLGRTIKREATSMGQNGQLSPKESALFVVLLIEALLCFMINLAAISHSKHSADPDWPSIIPYHIFVFRHSRPFPQLHGIAVQLGAVCRQYIHKYDMDRLARDPLPDEQVGSAPTPGSDGNTKTNDDGEKYKQKYIKFRDGLVENSRELQTAWLNGSRELSLDTIEREFPKTWRKRAKDSTLRGVGRPNPARILEDFFLPLDANATTFEAVRFTLAFLDEWTEREKVEWKPRINI